MKRLLSAFLAFCTLMTLLPAHLTASAMNETVLYGDADGNGSVDLEDVLVIERYIADSNTPLVFINAGAEGEPCLYDDRGRGYTLHHRRRRTDRIERCIHGTRHR
ncbi:MAG: hypothetical protein PHZ09_12950 [Eubacteriales bacterium]|nr:hypothetical protein [Eubacteriales bacterium]